MQIFVKTLTGKTVTLVVDRTEVGPVREDGTFYVKGFNAAGRLILLIGAAVLYSETYVG